MDIGVIRISIFIAVLLAMLAFELAWPRRKLNYSKLNRWKTNLLMIVVDTVVVRVVLPLTSIAVAQYVAINEWGLFNLFALAIPVEIFLAVLLLDLAIYGQHVASHVFPMLWRFHRVHHADPDIDATTGIRFHPIEILLSLIYKFVLIVIIGPSVLAVIIFEIVLNSTALFNHANIRLPLGLDKILRWFIVTPDVHRTHHSIIPEETNSNYGFNLTIWDRLFGTWVEHPSKGHDGMEIGLSEYQRKDPTGLIWCLMFPFKK